MPILASDAGALGHALVSGVISEVAEGTLSHTEFRDVVCIGVRSGRVVPAVGVASLSGVLSIVVGRTDSYARVGG